MTTVRGIAFCELRMLINESPEMPGIRRSSSMRSISCYRSTAIASKAESASNKRHPRTFKAARKLRRTGGSSSTTRIRSGRPDARIPARVGEPHEETAH